jgi:lipopolysaccharide transport system ATP-binding protein
MAIAIKAENISKQYRLGYVGSGSLKDDARRWWARMRGKEDPLLTVGETNDRSTKGESEYVWALKDINFEIEQGDTVGIIGRNGAGKSTLLKILSKVTAPTTGNIKVKGRIASLLEVGTGFHGELTGRENIYLNGAIMGMRKHEITRKLDEIVDFAGVERYLDTPVKRYSSGMYVRLGFAVAAHLENEILIVDEVLAVGDAEFQSKCLGKMGDVAKGEGKTILFVSHNLDAINFLCNSAMLIEKGQIVSDEKHLSKDDILRKYKNLNSGAEKKLYLKYHSNSNDTNLIREVYFSDKRNNFMFEEEFRLYIKVNVVSKVNLSIELCNSNNLRIWVKEKKITNSGIYCIKFNKNHLILGEYKIKCYLTIPNVEYIQITDELFFNIENWPKEFFHYSNIDKQKNPIGIIYNSEEIEKSN